MKSFGDLLKELGFNPNAPESVQKAFFTHLAKEAETLKQQNQTLVQPDLGPAKKPELTKGEQLTMDFGAVDSIVCTYNKKVS